MTTFDKHTEAAALLEASGNYRVLRRLMPRSQFSEDDGSPRKIGIVLDVETTGLDYAKDEIIELGMVKFEFAPDGRIFRILDTYNQLRQTERDEKALITPATILQELSIEVVEQIDSKSVVGFRRAWDEMTDYHQFLIEIHNTQDEDGNLLSLAQIGDAWIAPHQDWNYQYVTPVDRALQLFEIEPDFAARVVRLPYYLMPENAVPARNAPFL